MPAITTEQLAKVIEEHHIRLSFEERLSTYIIAAMGKNSEVGEKMAESLSRIEPEEGVTDKEWFNKARDKRVETIRAAIKSVREAG